MDKGIYQLNFEASRLEKNLFDRFSNILDDNGYEYLSVPSSVDHEVLMKQGVMTTLSLDSSHALSGSAEQGILQYFQGTHVDRVKLYAINSCFRVEDHYHDLIRLKEFKKIEQFCFTDQEHWESDYNTLLTISTDFLKEHCIRFRVRDVTNDDGYHILKKDIEIYTDKHGWIESHSCTYFGEEQTKRFGITGAKHTISNTGLASPRILIPFLQ